VLGVCHRSESHRILASELVDLDEDGKRHRESIHRIVEFG
jgi:hypothetical protein